MRGTWDDVNRRLVGALLSLDLDDVLVVGERRPPARRGLLGGLLGGGRPEPPRRYVQVTAAERVLIAECVGSPATGGPWPLTPEQEDALRRQGWEEPWQDGETTWQREAPLVGAPRLAVALVKALQLLGCEVADLEVERSRESPDAGDY